MKEWWINLSLREKQAVMIGGVCLGIFLIYAWMWSPLNNHVDALRHRLKQDQQLWVWMQSAERQMQSFTQTNMKSNQALTSPMALLGFIQEQMNQSAVVSSVVQLKQGNNDTVELFLKKASFDELIAWLIKITASRRAVLTQLTVIADPAPGMVQAKMTFALNFSA